MRAEGVSEARLNWMAAVARWKTMAKDDYSMTPKGLVLWSGGTVKGADTSTFQRLNCDYGKDNQHVYWRRERISKDVASFQVLNGTWAKDSNRVYCVGRRLTKADAGSFHVLNELYAKDSQSAFYLEGIIKEADAESFVSLDNGYHVYDVFNAFGDKVRTGGFAAGFAADKTHIFHYAWSFGKPCVLRGADPKSFQVLQNGFGKDEKNVYFEKNRVKGADPQTFQVIDGLWAHDKKAVYYGAGKIDGADPSSFQVISSYDLLGKDAEDFFWANRRIDRSMAIPPGGTVPGFPLASAASMEQFRSYLERGATPNDPLALQTACRTGNTDAVRLMLEAGCNPNVTDASQNSALIHLPYGNYMEVAKLLVEAGANVNQMRLYSPFEDHDYLRKWGIYSPLEMALFHDRLDLAEYLISNGANVNTETGSGEKLIRHFRKLNKAKVVEFLNSHGAAP